MYTNRILFFLLIIQLNGICQLTKDNLFISDTAISRVDTAVYQSPSHSTSGILVNEELRIIDNGLIVTKFNNSPEIKEITKGICNTYLSRDMFGCSSAIDVESYYYGNDYTIFFLDPVWGRIIFANSTNYEIKSYGDHTGEYVFNYPAAMATDYDGKIYVADEGKKKIVVLQYNSATHSISLLGELSIPSLQGPQDICLSTSSSGQKKLFVIDNYRRLIIIDTNGNILNEFTGYRDNNANITYTFDCLERIGVSKTDPNNLLLYENTRSLVFFCSVASGNTLNAQWITHLPRECYFSDIGMNCFGEFYIPDMIQNLIHKFNSRGVYVCSYRSAPGYSGFNYPVRVSNISENLNGKVILNLEVSCGWGTNSGITRFLLGSHIWDLHSTTNNNNYNFEWYVSERSKFAIEVYRNNQLIMNNTLLAPYSGFVGQSVPEATLGTGNIKFRVKYMPERDGVYGEYQQGWLYEDLNLKIIPIPQNLQAGPHSGDNYIQLTWQPTNEQNFQCYEIYRKVLINGETAEWLKIADVSPQSTNTYVDTQYKWITKYDDYQIDYKMLVRDAQNNCSEFSNTVNVNAIPTPKINVAGVEETPKSFLLEGNFPNPFNPSTIIKYQLPSDERVSLKVYDILGREIAVLADDFQKAGRYRVNFDAGRLASGIYIYRIKAGRFTQTRKMIVAK